MDHIRLISIFALIMLLFSVEVMMQKVLKRSKRNHVHCRPKSLVTYRLTVHTLWSKQTFPKMFPTYRPHAQWSSLVGRTHGSEYQMWDEGLNASLGVKLFAEQGDSSQLNTESVQGYDGILDGFVASPVNRSTGHTSTVIILDGHHSKLSFMMKIIPSPDWFIGVSSLDLCAHGRWKNKVQIDLHPFDAGTDQGLTFTAPNWPNAPAVPISAITSSFPDHPASSFFYPEYEELPRLAYLELDIVSEFRHRETFMKVPQHYISSNVEDDDENERKELNDEQSTSAKLESKQMKPQTTTDTRSHGNVNKNRYDRTSVNEDIFAAPDVLDPSNTSWSNVKEVHVSDVKGNSLKTKHISEDKISLHGHSDILVSTTPKAEVFDKMALTTVSGATVEETSARRKTEVGDDTNHDRISQFQGHATGKTEVGHTRSVVRTSETNADEMNDKSSRMRHVFSMTDLLRGPGRLNLKQHGLASTLETTSTSFGSSDKSQFSEASTRHMAKTYDSSAVDCEVGEWSDWSPCSQTCGFGQQERSRSVSVYPQNGGANCPRLRQTNWCGSMRNCTWNHFSFLEPNTTKRQLREGLNGRRNIQTKAMSEKGH